jgi:hypothetical protein
MSKNDMQSMLQDFKAEITADLKDEVEKSMRAFEERTSSSFTARTATLLTKYDEAQTQKFNALHSNLAEIQARCDKSERDNAELWKTVRQLQDAMAMARDSAMAQDVLDNDEFDRPVQLDTLRVGTAIPVSREALLEATKSWLAELKLSDEMWTLTGPTTGKQFSLRFLGLPVVAARWAKKANTCLKQSDGTWKDILVEDENGGTTNLFIGEDRNPKMLVQDRLGRRIASAVRELHPKMHIFYRKRDSTVFIQSKPVIRPVADSREEFRFLWDHAQVDRIGLVKQTIMDKLHELENNATSSNPQATWRV